MEKDENNNIFNNTQENGFFFLNYSLMSKNPLF